MSRDSSYWFRVFAGLFEHRKRISNAIWVFLWCIAKTTKEVLANGKAEGLVLGGQPVPLKTIALDLDMSTDAVYEHLAQLAEAGYIRKIPHGNGRPNGYAVTNSKKFIDRRTKAGWSDPETVVQEPDGTVVQEPEGTVVQTPGGTLGLLPVDPRAFVGGPSYKSPSVDKEDKRKEKIGKKNDVHFAQPDFVFQGEQIAPLTPSNGPTRPTTPTITLDGLVKDGWLYYLEATGRHADQYRFDDKRRRMGIAGFQSLVKFAAHRNDPDPPGRAALMFRVAVDRMCSSPFHSGENPEGKRHQEWHHLFTAKNYPSPTKLLEFWLDEHWGGKEKPKPTFDPVAKPLGVVERGGVA